MFNMSLRLDFLSKFTKYCNEETVQTGSIYTFDCQNSLGKSFIHVMKHKLNCGSDLQIRQVSE